MQAQQTVLLSKIRYSHFLRPEAQDDCFKSTNLAGEAVTVSSRTEVPRHVSDAICEPPFILNVLVSHLEL